MIFKESLIEQGDLDWVSDTHRHLLIQVSCRACPESVEQFQLDRNPNKMIQSLVSMQSYLFKSSLNFIDIIKHQRQTQFIFKLKSIWVGDNLSTFISIRSCKSIHYLKHERNLFHQRRPLNFVALWMKELYRNWRDYGHIATNIKICTFNYFICFLNVPIKLGSILAILQAVGLPMGVI